MKGAIGILCLVVVASQDLDFEGTVTRDAELMTAAGINVVRIYEPIRERGVLDTLWRHGIFVIYSVYPYGGSPVADAVVRADRVKDHPAILMWALVMSGITMDCMWALAFKTRLAGRYRSATHQADRPHSRWRPIWRDTTSATLNGLPDIDVWESISTGLFFVICSMCLRIAPTNLCSSLGMVPTLTTRSKFRKSSGPNGGNASLNSPHRDESTKRDGICSGGVI